MRIFISGVVAETGGACSSIAAALSKLGLSPVVAVHEGVTAVSLGDVARDIAECAAVISILGDRCGTFPDELQIAALGDVAYYHNFCADTGAAEASFMQWHLLIACQLGRPVIVIELGPDVPRDQPNPERGDRQTDQRAFKRWVAELALDRHVVASTAQLVPIVLAAVATLPEAGYAAATLESPRDAARTHQLSLV